MTSPYTNKDAFEEAMWPAFWGVGSLAGEGLSLLFGVSHGLGLIFAGVAFLTALTRCQAALARNKKDEDR